MSIGLDEAAAFAVLPLEKEVIAPTGLLLGQVVLQPYYNDGVPTYQAIIELKAVAEDKGKFSDTGQRNSFSIADINNADADIKGVEAGLKLVREGLEQVAAAVNAVRKVL